MYFSQRLCNIILYIPQNKILNSKNQFRCRTLVLDAIRVNSRLFLLRAYSISYVNKKTYQLPHFRRVVFAFQTNIMNTALALNTNVTCAHPSCYYAYPRTHTKLFARRKIWNKEKRLFTGAFMVLLGTLPTTM